MIRIFQPPGYRLGIIMRKPTEQRLLTTCFRGDVCKAGNFSRWFSFTDLLADSEVKRQILADVSTRISQERSKEAQGKVFRSYPESLTFTYPVPVGWVTTVPLTYVRGLELEQTKLNASPTRHAYGLMVTDRNAKAPKTRLVTVKYQLKLEGPNYWTAIMHTMYPGRDIGPLEGNLTEKTQRAFFDFGNPGDPSKICDE